MKNKPVSFSRFLFQTAVVGLGLGAFCAGYAQPVVGHLAGDVLAYAENQDQTVTPALVDTGGDATVTATGGWTGGTLKIEFLAGSNPDQDVLSFGNYGTGAGQIQAGWVNDGTGSYGNNVMYSGSLVGTWQPSGGVSGTPVLMTFNARATNATVTALVNNLRFTNYAQFAPTTDVRTVRFTFTDAAGHSTTADTTVTVTPVNDAPRFLGAGYTATDVGNAVGTNADGQAVAQQPDGKYLVLLAIRDKDWNVHVAVARYQQDGTLDPTFGNSGIYQSALGNATPSMSIKGLLVRHDAAQAGKIIAAFTDSDGAGNDSIVLLQLTKAGEPDEGFGTHGVCRFDAGAPGTLEEVGQIAQQPDGKIIAVGSFHDGAERNITVWRFLADGSGLDTSFSTTGYVNAPISSSYSYGYNVFIQPDGKIAVGGVVHGSNNTTDPWDLGVRRYNSDGTLDTTFGTAGMTQIDYAHSNDAYTCIARQTCGANAGKIIVVGDYVVDPEASSPKIDLTVARLNTDGSLDTTFGSSGRTTVDVSGNNDDYPAALALDANDRIVICGAMGGTAAVVRLTAEGALDTTLNGTGKLLLPDLGENPSVESMLVDADNKIVLVGYVQDAAVNPVTSGPDQFATLIRLTDDGHLDAMGSPPFAKDGAPVVLDQDTEVYDGELMATNYAGASLTLSRHGGASPDDSFSASGTLSLAGGNVVVGGTTVGTFTQNAGTLTIVYNANATTESVAQTMRQLCYGNSAPFPPASVKIDWLFSDGNTGGEQGTGGVKTATVSTTVVVTQPPAITNMSAPADGFYRSGQNLDFTASYTIPVTVSGSPRLALNIGGSTVYANYVSGSTTSALVFRYTVQSGDNDGDGITVASPVDLNGGTIVANLGGSVASDIFTAPNAAAVVVDTVAPTTTVATAALSSDTGISATDFVTNTAAQTISGSLSAALAAGETVQVSLDNGLHWTSATAPVGSSAWSLSGQTLTSSDTLKVHVVDAAGNGGAVFSQDYVLDVAAPAAPTVVTLAAVGGNMVPNALNGTNSNLTASATIPAAQATGGKAELYVGATLVAIDNVIAAGDTTVTFDLGTANAADLQAIVTAGDTATVKLYDLAGNAALSSVGNPVLTVDYLSPDAPTAVTLTPMGGTVVPNALNLTNTNLRATAAITAGQATGGKAELFVGAVRIAADSSIAVADTQVTFDLGAASSAALQGAVAAGGLVTVRLYDQAGNMIASTAGNPTLVVVYAHPAAPSAPDLVAGKDTGSSNTDDITTATTPTFAGTAPANSTVELFRGGTTSLGATTADGAGTWTFTPGAPLAAGNYSITAAAIDAAGNTSAASAALALTIDTTAPTITGRAIPANGTYRVGECLDFTITYSEPVFVTNYPYIVVTFETGGVDTALYRSGSGGTTLHFRHTILNGREDRNGITVASAITPNGGTIRDAAGNDAVITGLGFDSTAAVLVDSLAPRAASIVRQTPATSPTNADSLTWRVTFSEPVQNVDVTDFSVSGTTASKTVTSLGGNAYDVTVSGGDLANLNATVTLGFADGKDIQDTAGNALTNPTPTGTNENTYYVLNDVPPVITNLNGDNVTYTEDALPVLLDAGNNATVADADSADFDGGNVTVSIVADRVAGEDVLAVRNEGTGANQIGVAGSTITYAGATIGTITGGTGTSDLVIAFNSAGATPEAAQAVVRNLTYRNANSAAPAGVARTVRVTVNDGDGGTSAPADVTVAITAANDAPTDIVLAPATVVRSAAANAAVGTLTTTDPDDGDTFTYALVSGTGDTNNGSFDLAGAVVRATNPHTLVGGAASIRVRATDAGGLGCEKALAITVVDDLLVVSSNADSGPGSLRQAIADLPAGGTIGFALPTGSETITLASELAASDSLTIDGRNAAGSGVPIKLQVPAPGASPWRVLNLNLGPAAQVVLRNLTLQGGNVGTDNGGAIQVLDGRLDLYDVAISDGVAEFGGALACSSAVRLTRCTFNNNAARSATDQAAGGAIYALAGTLVVVDSTISGNSAQAGGAGCGGSGVCTFVETTIINCTITGNTVSGAAVLQKGGGVYFDGAHLNILNSIIAGNTALSGGDLATSGTGTINAYYTWYGLADGSIGGTGDAPNQTDAFSAAHLEALADNGGSTRTVRVAAGAPAVGNGTLVYDTDGTAAGFSFLAGDGLYHRLQSFGTTVAIEPTGKIATDQRGMAREVPTTIGAFQTGPAMKGRVTIAGGAGLAGVTINCGGHSATTDANGDFAVSDLSPATYVVAPSLSGYTFSPTNRSVVMANASVAAVDFAASVVQPPPSKDPQTISFAALPDAKVGETCTLGATASSGLAVRFTLVSGPATLTGTSLTFTGIGTVVIRASQSGNSNYTAAPSVERSCIVRAAAPVDITAPPPPPVGGSIALEVPAADSSVEYQWQRNGVDLRGATTPALTLPSMQPPVAGLYTYTASTSTGTSGTSAPVIVGVASTQKVEGTGEVVGSDIHHQNGNVYDQLLLEGKGATLTADHAQVTRMSFCDLTGDIVQVELSGAGTLALVMDDASQPHLATNYNQPDVHYVSGHVGIVITGANETTNVCVFSVGRITAVNQGLFRSDVDYDATADIAFIAIQSANGKFGGLRTGNVSYVASTGFAGVYAPGVQFTGPVNVGNIRATDSARPMLVLGSAPAVRITGGDLSQPNHQPIAVHGLSELQFTDGTTSQGELLPAQRNAGVLQQDGIDVTDLIVVEN